MKIVTFRWKRRYNRTFFWKFTLFWCDYIKRTYLRINQIFFKCPIKIGSENRSFLFAQFGYKRQLIRTIFRKSRRHLLSMSYCDYLFVANLNESIHFLGSACFSHCAFLSVYLKLWVVLLVMDGGNRQIMSYPHNPQKF